MSAFSFCQNSIIQTAPGVVSANMEGEEVILNLETGIYFGLDEIGARVWSLIERPNSISSIVDVILEEYEVDRERCLSDLIALVQEMHEARLVESRDM